MKLINNNRITLLALTAILVLIYVYIFTILLNYDMAYVNLEKLRTHLWILENGKQWVSSDFVKGLDTKVIEIDPNRISRPLSNMIEIINAKFRSNLWDYIPPHPSISILWPFLFIGIPFFLYKFFRNIGCHSLVSLSGVCLYLTSLGFLSPIVMLFHPSKNLVNFFAVLSLATITGLYTKNTNNQNKTSIKEIPHFWLILFGWFCWTMLAFLSDETGLFLYLILIFICTPLILRFKEKTPLIAGLILLPLVYYAIVHFLLPWLHFVVNHESVNLKSFKWTPRLSSLFFPNLHNLFFNAYLLLSDHPNIKLNFTPIAAHPFLIFLQCVYSLSLIFICGLVGFIIYKTKKISSRVKQILAGFLLLIFYIFFHTFQLSNNMKSEWSHVWCLWWYGCIFSLIYYTTLTLSLQYIWEEFKFDFFKKILPLLIFILALHGLSTSTYRINIFKYQNLDPSNYPHPSIFNGSLNRYDYFDLKEKLQRSRCRYVYTLLYWAKVKQKHVSLNQKEIEFCTNILDKDRFFKTEILYFTIEGAFEFPMGHSFLNDHAFVSAVKYQLEDP